MGCNKPAANWKSDKKEEMVLDWTYFEKNKGHYREGHIGLESAGCTEVRSSKKNLEEKG
jgi:hypothetical protein